MNRTNPVINDSDAKSRDGRTSCYQSPTLFDRTGNKGSTNSYEEADHFVDLLPLAVSCLLASNGRVTAAVTSSKAVLMSCHPKSRSTTGGTANCKS